mmetsp:Transcript_12003/g.17069  ORF Transcript_12003/g.17069 Transcript_12003/m.17069 type:complete len:442 (+) Transcript_12003:1108-2433(+)
MLLASSHGTPDPCIRLWKYNQHVERWSLVATLRGGMRTIRSIAFAPTPPNVRKILAAASFDGTVSIWEDFSSNGNDNDNNNNSTNHNINKNQNVIDKSNRNHFYEEDHTDLDIHHQLNGNTNNGWECTTQLEGHDNEVKDVCWNAFGTLLATCGRDKSVWIWECFLPGTIGGDGTGSNHPTDEAASGEGEYECIAVLHGHEGDVKSIKFAPSYKQWGDGDEILLSSSYDDTIKCWAEDGGDWYCAATLASVHSSTIWSIAISPSGLRMISASQDASLAIWKCYSVVTQTESSSQNSHANASGQWKCVGKLPAENPVPILSIDIAPSCAGHGHIASADAGQCIKIYAEVSQARAKQSKVNTKFQLHEHQPSHLSHNTALAKNNADTGNQNAFNNEYPLFQLNAIALDAHMGDVNSIKWHPKYGSTLASAGDDGLVKIWKVDV